jgi:hypothetical protein
MTVVYTCPICKTGNAFVNQCGCDPNNMPTKLPVVLDVQNTFLPTVDAVYTQEFDDELQFTAECKYDPNTKRVFAIGTPTRPDMKTTDSEGLVDVITDEFVTLPDGTVLSEFDGITFDHGE